MELKIPGYKLRRVIGKGGMARVYLAEQEIFGREVALKVMSRSLSEDPAFGKRFFREAQIVAKLVHPNVVTVHDVGVHKGYYYLSMEHLDGQDLKVRRHNLTITQKITAIRDIAKALDYAGGKGYVHRDIKPENIMFQEADGRAVLTDFGIARAAKTDVAMTQTGIAIGTPHYMSPEQAKGKPVDGRSDIYSLGIVFYLLMVGRVPYDAESAVAIGIKHITEPVPLLPPGYETLQGILDRMMAKPVDRRYQSAALLIDDLDSIDLDRLIESVKSAEVHYQNEYENPSLSDQQTVNTDQSQAEIETERFTVTEEAIRDLPQQRFFLPWIMSFLLVGAGVLSAIYILRPKPLIPIIQKAEELSKSAMESGQNYWQQTLMKFKKAPEKDSSFVPAEFPKEAISESLSPSDKKSELAASGSENFDVSDSSGLSLKPQSSESKETAQKKSPENIKIGLPVNSVDNPSSLSSDAVISTQTRASEIDDERIDIPVDVDNSSENPILTKYLSQLAESKYAYTKDSSLLAEYVDAHRDILANFPDNEYTLGSLSHLQSELKSALLNDARRGKYTSAREQLTQFRYFFSKLPADDFSALERQLKNVIKGRSLLKKAKQYLSNNDLTKPEKANALASYRRVLELDPQNQEAKEGLNSVIDKLVSFATSNYNNGQIILASQQVETVLGIDPNNVPAKLLKRDLQDTSVSDRTIEGLLDNAQDAIARGDLFEPSTSNAYDFYQMILNMDVNNLEAQQGIKKITDHLSKKVWALLDNEEYINARLNLRRPLELMPDDSVVQSLNRSVEDLIAEKQSSDK